MVSEVTRSEIRKETEMIQHTTNQNEPEIEIHYDKVIIEGMVILKPVRLSSSQWMRFWEDAIKPKIDR